MNLKNMAKITKKHLKSDPGQNHYIFKGIDKSESGAEYAILADSKSSTKLFKLKLTPNLKASLSIIKVDQWLYLIEQDHIIIKQTLDDSKLFLPSNSQDVSVDLNDPGINSFPEFPSDF